MNTLTSIIFAGLLLIPGYSYAQLVAESHPPQKNRHEMLEDISTTIGPIGSFAEMNLGITKLITRGLTWRAIALLGIGIGDTLIHINNRRKLNANQPLTEASMGGAILRQVCRIFYSAKDSINCQRIMGSTGDLTSAVGTAWITAGANASKYFRFLKLPVYFQSGAEGAIAINNVGEMISEKLEDSFDAFTDVEPAH